MSEEQHDDDNETFANPLAGAFGAPPVEDLGAGEPQEPDNDPDGTARMLATSADWLVTMKYNMPLTEQEGAELRADLAAVLKKHDVPNLPYQEELSLGMTVGGIVFRRAVAAKKQSAAKGADAAPAEAPVQQGVGHGNYSSTRQEGERKIRFAAQDMFSGVNAESRAVLP